MITVEKTSKDVLEASDADSLLARTEKTTDQTETFASDHSFKTQGGKDAPRNKELTPLEAARKKSYESEAKKNQAKEKLFNVLKWLTPIFVSLLVGLIAIWGTIWLYKIDKLSYPIGTLEEKTKNMEIRLDKVEGKMDTLGNKLQETREEFIRSK